MRDLSLRQSMILILTWRSFQLVKLGNLPRKLESSKSTARHIKQMSSELQATQVNLLRHKRTEIPPNKSKWKPFNNKSRSKNVGTQLKPISSKHHTRSLIQGKFLIVMTDFRNVEIPSI